MKKFFNLLLICFIITITLTSCGLSSDREDVLIKKIAGQCDHIASLSFDGTNTAKTESLYDTNNNTYTLYVINNNISSKEMEDFKWQGNGSVILNLENSINSLCLSMKDTFDNSDLKSEDYDVIIHFTDRNKKIYYTSTNGVMKFSAWGR